MAEVPAFNLLTISAIEILAMDCMAPSLTVVNAVNHAIAGLTLRYYPLLQIDDRSASLLAGDDVEAPLALHIFGHRDSPTSVTLVAIIVPDKEAAAETCGIRNEADR